MAQKLLNVTYDWRFTGAGLPGFGSLIESNAQKVSDNFDDLFTTHSVPGQVAIDVDVGFVANAGAIADNLATLAAALSVSVGTIDEAVDFLFTGAGVPGFETRAESNAQILEAAFTALYAAAASWTHTGTHYLSSDGASGSYADAATSAAAAIILTVAGSDYTLGMWLRFDGPTSGGAVEAASSGAAVRAGVVAFDDGEDAITGDWGDAYGVDYSTMRHVMLVASGGVLALHVDADGGASSGVVTAGAAGVSLTLFARAGPLQPLACDIRDFAIWDRALSSAEVAALHTAGAGHDLSEDVGAYTGGGPAHWWPADGDTGTTVTDRGSVGGCNLTLHGGVTIEEA